MRFRGMRHKLIGGRWKWTSEDSVDSVDLSDDSVGISELSATGTASDTTFLRGDNAWAAAGGLFSDFALLQERQDVGVDGGSLVHGTWYTRAINTEVYDGGNIVTLSNNVFTLGAGTYLINYWSTTYGRPGGVVVGIADVGGQSDVYLNWATQANHNDYVMTRAGGSTVQTFTGSTDLELVLRATKDRSSIGLGQAIWDGEHLDFDGQGQESTPANAFELYSEVQIYKFA